MRCDRFTERLSILGPLLCVWVCVFLWLPGSAAQSANKSPWDSLISDAEALKLPTRFLRVIPSGF